MPPTLSISPVLSAQFFGYSSRKGAKGAKLAKGRGRPHAENAEAQREERGRIYHGGEFGVTRRTLREEKPLVLSSNPC